MARPWTVLDRVDTDDGPLELRRRGTASTSGSADYMITVDGRSLMISGGNRSELALASEACAACAHPERVLIGGLGMGFTLRAALDAVGPRAHVTVAELTPQVVTWCQGELGALTGHACADPRVEVQVADVADVIAGAARPGATGFDVIILDLYEGPHAATQHRDDPFYGSAALARTARALRAGGVLAIWSEEADRPFEERLSTAGFDWRKLKRGRGRLHVIYLATRR